MSLSPELRDRISSLVESHRIFLFMKGTRDLPQCGFSATVIQILDRLAPDYATFDVLSDSEIRASIKEFSQWPTIPQLYIAGEFVGGCDIVREMYQKGELHAALGLPAPARITPKITITDEAAQILRQAMQRPEAQPLHLSIDALLRSSLTSGPRQDDELEVESNGITLLLDYDTAPRADGVTLQLVQTQQGPKLELASPKADSPPSK
jgi:monothiol glutaredoxin